MKVTYSRSCNDISSLFSFSKKHFEFFWKPSQIEDQVNNKDSINYFAYEEQSIIGYAFFNLNRFSNQAHLYQICVDPIYRSKGIGKRLIEMSLIDMLGDCDSVFLEVETTNSTAIRFYEKLGFEKLNKISSFYSNGNDAYAMHSSSSMLAKELKN